MDFSSFIHNTALVCLLCSTHFSLAIVDTIGPSESLADGETLVSKQGIFELGFFSPGNSKSRYLGIWYKKISIRTVVWVANQCNPIPDSSGLFKINSTRYYNNLSLLNQNKSTVAWSTSIPKRARKPILHLLDTGNLVLRDEEGIDSEANYLWQSFDYPSDKLLSGMKLGWDLKRGLNRRLSTWKSWDNPCPGDLSLGYEAIIQDKIPEAIMFQGEKKFYRIGPWNGLGASGVPKLTNNQLFASRFYESDEEVYYKYDLKNESVISILVINQTTSTLQRVTWIDEVRDWRVYSSEPRDFCDGYGRCGANAKCVISEAQVCECLRGFEPKSPAEWNSTDWSGGCIRISNDVASCEKKHKDGFVRLNGLKVPDTTVSWGKKTMNLKECKEKCLRNISCTAYSNSDLRGKGSGCIIWFGDLVDIRKSHSTLALDLYVRVSASELSKTNRETRVRIFIAIAVVFSGLFFLGNIYIFKKSSSGSKIESDENIIGEQELPLFELSAIRVGTCNFSVSNKLGQGGYGPVYRGKLEDGQEIAVKRLCMNSGQGLDEFKNEVILIAKLQHRNLVKLLGCCIEGDEKSLVYEYMPNKSLDSFIFDKIQCKLINWPRRFEIISGIARGLQYLHQDSRLRIVHRDLKASNILLDKEMNPKISDFGMARTFGGDQTEGNTNRVVGTYGYMAPEYANNGLFSTKSDVFSFGITVLEIISGKRSRGFQPQVNGNTLTGHAWTLMKQGRSLDLVDKCLRLDYSIDNNLVEEVLRCIHVGLLCVQQRPSDRPSMSSVILMLSSESLLPEPKQPGYFMEEDIEVNISSCRHESSSTNEMTITSLDAR